MNCDPKSLLQAARCYRCIPAGVMRSAIISQLCRWANTGGGPPAETIHYEPESGPVRWSDDYGATWNDEPNYAAFIANAPLATLTSLDWYLPLAPSNVLTSLTGLNTLPMLDYIRVEASNLTVLDCSNCSLLTRIISSSQPTLTEIILTGCVALDQIDSRSCGNLTTLTGLSTCTAITFMVFTNSNLGGGGAMGGILDLTGLNTLVTVFVDGNFNLQDVVLAGCSGLDSLDCSLCDCTDLDFSDCSVINSVNVGIQVTGLTALTFAANSPIASLTASFNSLAAITGLSTFTNPSYLELNDNLFVTADIGSANTQVEVYLQNNFLTQAAVDLVLSRLATNCTGNAGTCDLDGAGGGPNATPSAAGFVDKAILEAGGTDWIVTTN